MDWSGNSRMSSEKKVTPVLIASMAQSADRR